MSAARLLLPVVRVLRVLHVVALLAVLALPAMAEPQDELLGCWRATRITQVFADGSKSVSAGSQCTLQFKRDEFVSTCAFSQRPTVTTYRYNITRDGVYSATMLTSTASTQLIGTTRDYEFKISGDTLAITSRPKVTTPAPANATVHVDSESSKVACD
ncbi:hypothetical protein GHT07_18705 [Caenimonas koreensis DSM 17982]|uniref:Lipocalin-like domain-containing protein n=1 Tax=Caenimonas koreensis DSM 17982 TaxID=1121255 RepID=A0A844AXN7_9BURK|nr:hypothetical protein [Caenimonas koreensis]MRD49310.1 hypothetical protein [Caenimonas koreensis DSM 17982]